MRPIEPAGLKTFAGRKGGRWVVPVRVPETDETRTAVSAAFSATMIKEEGVVGKREDLQMTCMGRLALAYSAPFIGTVVG